MRKSVAVVACALTFLASTAVGAEGFNNLYAAINGLATFPADPVMGAVEPSEDYDKMPFAQVTGRMVGFGAGTVMMAYRATTAVLDLVFMPFWVFPTLSPEPRWELIPEVEYE
jgi:hypothetical protein